VTATGSQIIAITPGSSPGGRFGAWCQSVAGALSQCSQPTYSGIPFVLCHRVRPARSSIKWDSRCTELSCSVSSIIPSRFSSTMSTNLYKGQAVPPTRLGPYRLLSPTAGMCVSPLRLGRMSIGDKWESCGMMCGMMSYALLDAYYQAGGNFIDNRNS